MASASNALADELRGGAQARARAGKVLLIAAATIGAFAATAFVAGWWAAARSIGKRQRWQLAAPSGAAGTGSCVAAPTVVGGIRYAVGDAGLTGQELHFLSTRAWGRSKPAAVLELALRRTVNISARDPTGHLVGCCRVLSDGFFSTVPEVLVAKDKQGRGIGKHLLTLAAAVAPGPLCFGVQPGNEAFFERCGFRDSGMAFFENDAR